jgi:wyosine [tRNA(Phe)-imidazoG37] synthetase (radical SAM superfamily)
MANAFVLSTQDHDRSRLGHKYVYAVFSRRAGGLSVGVNLNPNNACNWRCVYCQVPNLRRGVAPPIELGVLEHELREVVADVVKGDFLLRHLPEGARVFRDIAISGNGEPTTAREISEVVAVIATVRRDLGVGPEVATRLITNGTMLHRPEVQRALEGLAQLGGETWVKLDAGNDAALERVSGVRWTIEQALARLREAAVRCPTWIQSCFFCTGEDEPPSAEIESYLAALRRVIEQRIPIRGVQLYTIARRPQQPHWSSRLKPVSRQWLEALREQLSDLPVPVVVAA